MKGWSIRNGPMPKSQIADPLTQVTAATANTAISRARRTWVTPMPTRPARTTSATT